MTSKILIQLDTNNPASTFDAVVAYDGGIDHLIAFAGIDPSNCQDLVEGAIYTRAPKDKKNTAIFIGGNNLDHGEALLKAVQDIFFSSFTVSIMLDSNGCNTTAAAAVALLDKAVAVAGKQVCVLAGTGPVGQRIATMLVMLGAKVMLSSRTLARAQQVCARIQERFGVAVEPCEISNEQSAAQVLTQSEILVATGKGGVCLLKEQDWKDQPKLEALVDVSTRPPAGIEGVEIMDKAAQKHGKIIFGGIGIGAFKLKLHRQCIKKLFTSNTLILDAQEILEIARNET